ncbi:MAG: PRC-barrel domain-containing protein [Pseudolabrys sp.]
MLKQILMATALTAALLTPAMAQTTATKIAPNQATTQSMPQQSSGQRHVSFVQSQNASEWRSSKLIGADVYGADNKKIGDINDLLVDGSGNIHAAVIGVGGFLGVGEKNVAVPFHTLNMTRKANSDAIDKVNVSLTKDELNNAPKFTWYQASGTSSQTTGSATNSTMNPAPAGKSMPSAPAK